MKEQRLHEIYCLEKAHKDEQLTAQLKELTIYHREHCPAYARMLDSYGFDEEKVTHYSELPFLPAGLFKRLTLSSMSKGEDDYKVVTSSGTSSMASKIVLDGENRTRQQVALAKIGADFLGKKRLPMLVIDAPSALSGMQQFSARAAGIRGFSLFGRYRTFALKEDMSLDLETLDQFLEKYGNEPFLIFGFTFLIWKYLVLALEQLGLKKDLSKGILVHGGGWKKLASQAVSKEEYKAGLLRVCGIAEVHDYYGMAEQAGSIFMECECGHLHASDYSGVLFRRASDFSLCNIGERGIIQVLSTLPKSYLGHSILTEDEGRLLGVDDCPCGRKGAYFEVIGRLKHAQIRGCSDTFQKNDRQKGLQFLLGDITSFNELAEQRPYTPFSEETINFLDALYQTIRKENHSVQAADLAAFSFWCRKGNLKHLRDQYACQWNGKKVIGRGVAFHVVPSNVPVLFAFSMVASLLAGNPVVLRMPEKETMQEHIILSCIRQVMEQQPEWKKRIVIVRYGHEKEVTDILSELCQVRVIWGGDHSIQEIQKSVLEPGKTELAFADRRSAAVFSAAEILKKEDLTDIVRAFYNDTYLNDQNACSSPSLVYWLGTKAEVQRAHERFWKAAVPYIQSNYELGAHLAVQKLEQAMCMAAVCENVQIKSCGNTAVLVWLSVLSPEAWNDTVPGGFFLECSGENLENLYPALTRKCQTLTCVGIDRSQMAAELIRSGVLGVDRVVETGHALDFSLIWDGIDLIRQMSRQIELV